MNEDPDGNAIQKFKNAGFIVLDYCSNTNNATGAGGGHIDLILEYNTDENRQLIDCGVPSSFPADWKGKDKVSDHYPYFVKVKIK